MLEKYKAKYSKEPNLPLFSALGYDGLMLICGAIESGSLTSEEIKDYLYKIKDFKGLSNTINFTREGSSPLFEKMYQIRDAGFIEVK